MSTYWGYHLTLDCSGCHVPSMQSKENVVNFIKHLVKSIDMEPIGEPWVEYTADGQSDKAGFTAVQIIVTSSIVAHFIDATGHIYLDVFSCKEFDVDIVKAVVKDSFLAKNMRMNFLTRQAG